MNKMEKQEKKQTIVRCTDCRTEFSGSSVSNCIDNAQCGRDGGEIKESCKACFRTDGKNLFKVVPIGKISKKDNTEDSDSKKE